MESGLKKAAISKISLSSSVGSIRSVAEEVNITDEDVVEQTKEGGDAHQTDLINISLLYGDPR
jgi:hypothetical protein